MKNVSLLLLMLLLVPPGLYAQVGINSDNSAPDPSAMLDIKSFDKGFLPPRMTHAEINAIFNPANGLFIYCTDCGVDGSGAFLTYINGAWNSMLTCIPPVTPVAGTQVPAENQVIWNWSTVPGASGYRWNTTDNYGNATDMGGAVTKTETGLTCNTTYTRYAWSYNSCGISAPLSMVETTTFTPPPAPEGAVHTPSPVQITWMWNAVAGATGYKWNTTNDYTTATDMGTATMKTETGLVCGTDYSRFVWAYTSCGASAGTTLTQSTTACSGGPCPGIPTVSYGGKTYNTVQIGTQCWLKENLNIGIMIPGTSTQLDNDILEKYCLNDLELNCDVYGGLYQWAEIVRYYMGATNSSSWNPVPSGYVKGICPEGWHFPSDNEWSTLTTCLGGENSAGGPLKETGTAHWTTPNEGATNSSGFTALGGGWNDPGTGGFGHSPQYGHFWSATESGSQCRYRTLNYNNIEVSPGWWNKTTGHSVRCVKDDCSTFSPVGVIINASANPVCAGTSVTFTATPDNGGTTPYYQWKINGVYAGTNSSSFTYIPVNGDVVTCVLSSSLNCVSGNPATSDGITMTVNAAPAGPAPGASSSFQTRITWVWNTVTGAAGYKWNTTDNYATATDMFNATSKIETDLVCNTPYTRFVWAYSGCGTSTATELVQSTISCGTSGEPCTGIPTVSYGGKTYNTVQIGTQCWLKESLNIGTMVNGLADQTDNSVIEKYCYGNSEAQCDVYGGLYQWNEMMQYNPMLGAQGICPPGWFIPTDEDWSTLASFLGGSDGAGGKLKEDGLSHWQTPNAGATNVSGFTALGAGHRDPVGNFASLQQYINLWSSTVSGTTTAYSRAIGYDLPNMWQDAGYEKSSGFSVRCLKNW